MQGLSRLIKQNIPIALVSRCFNGIAEPVYGYEGGGLNLQEQGVMFVKELNAPKARLKLLIALNAGLQGEDLKTYMEG
ncbi:Asparaginase [Avibacterium paragallinarum]|nr:Asparaginase [Avibacterium paragallinarum]